MKAEQDWLSCDSLENESAVRAVWSHSHRVRRRLRSVDCGVRIDCPRSYNATDVFVLTSHWDPESSVYATTRQTQHTQAQSKLQVSMQQIGGGKGGGQRTQRAPFVPVSERLCFGCKQPGHVLADCPNLSDAEKIAKMKDINTAKAAGKGPRGEAKKN